jgi:hypothetical protein
MITSYHRVYVALFIPVLLAGVFACRRDRTARLSAPLPFGVVDSIDEQQMDGTVRVIGWALSEDPIYTIGLYIDGRYITSARANLARPDVNKAYPAYGDVKPGWMIEFDGGMFPGEHELVVQVRTDHDAVRDLRQSRVVFRR